MIRRSDVEMEDKLRKEYQEPLRLKIWNFEDEIFLRGEGCENPEKYIYKYHFVFHLHLF